VPFSRQYNAIRHFFGCPWITIHERYHFNGNFDGQVSARAHRHTKRISFPFPPLVGISISVPTVTLPKMSREGVDSYVSFFRAVH
jgi:hypothetical protein